jgi:transcription elongation factor GreA
LIHLSKHKGDQMPDPIYLTPEGERKIQAELVELTGPGRDDLAKRLRSAIQMGDLSENADYHKAKEDQSFLEGRIQELEHILRNAVIIEETKGPKETITIGVTATIQEEGYDPETFYVVGAKEADPRSGKISNESPIGKALMNHRVGDVVDVETPAGVAKFTILGIK